MVTFFFKFPKLQIHFASPTTWWTRCASFHNLCGFCSSGGQPTPKPDSTPAPKKKYRAHCSPTFCYLLFASPRFSGWATGMQHLSIHGIVYTIAFGVARPSLYRLVRIKVYRSFAPSVLKNLIIFCSNPDMHDGTTSQIKMGFTMRQTCP